ncbi:hypothetical protein [Domibacillus epiphyticus]|uniref:Uncharacterized protein n=1 Tax=Domibacillus epiphyticus TaxID=1714355 RepID=A0A1V2A7R0_9BACI|nr:hypothetical protein [Domibacillus epiphyticus]OMP67041.1 hypothetical protein BTO28_08625 [Domibacillus epiphyticus]
MEIDFSPLEDLMKTLVIKAVWFSVAVIVAAVIVTVVLKFLRVPRFISKYFVIAAMLGTAYYWATHYF